MRLLRISSLELEEFDIDPPPYAIASHRWTKQEVTFQDLSRPREKISSKAGYKKILGFCEVIARLVSVTNLKVEYLWIDTCCIDKTNSVELQKALNSMFRWYAEAEVCLASLHDVVSLDVHPAALRKSLEESEWFQRGWTLQELIAPKCTFFYNRDWDMIGVKAGVIDAPWLTTRVAGLMPLNSVLTEITGVPDKVLSAFPNHIEEYSIDQRRSWMNGRLTTRKEDRVYCQLGIFGVFMPLIYGEGDHAMYRLEEAIEKQQRRVEAQARRTAVPPKSPDPPTEKTSGSLEGRESSTIDLPGGEDIPKFTIYYGRQTSEEKLLFAVRDDIAVETLIGRVLEKLEQTPWGRSQQPMLSANKWGLSCSGSAEDLLHPLNRVAELDARKALSLWRRG